MALVNALCTLADVKTLAGISDTSQDARLELIINQVSSQIASYCARVFARATHSAEMYAPSNRQLLILRQSPVISVSAVTIEGNAVTDYVVTPEYANAGMIYLERGWSAKELMRVFLTDDPVAGQRAIAVSYIAGYYLPGDVGYVAGADTSLPFDLQMVTCQMALAAYVQARRNNWDGLQSMTEGGLSYAWGAQTAIGKNNQSGLMIAHAGVLNKYRRIVVAA